MDPIPAQQPPALDLAKRHCFGRFAVGTAATLVTGAVLTILGFSGSGANPLLIGGSLNLLIAVPLGMGTFSKYKSQNVVERAVADVAAAADETRFKTMQRQLTSATDGLFDAVSALAKNSSSHKGKRQEQELSALISNTRRMRDALLDSAVGDIEQIAETDLVKDLLASEHDIYQQKHLLSRRKKQLQERIVRLQTELNGGLELELQKVAEDLERVTAHLKNTAFLCGDRAKWDKERKEQVDKQKELQSKLSHLINRKANDNINRERQEASEALQNISTQLDNFPDTIDRNIHESIQAIKPALRNLAVALGDFHEASALGSGLIQLAIGAGISLKKTLLFAVKKSAWLRTEACKLLLPPEVPGRRAPSLDDKLEWLGVEYNKGATEAEKLAEFGFSADPLREPSPDAKLNAIGIDPSQMSPEEKLSAIHAHLIAQLGADYRGISQQEKTALLNVQLDRRLDDLLAKLEDIDGTIDTLLDSMFSHEGFQHIRDNSPMGVALRQMERQIRTLAHLLKENLLESNFYFRKECFQQINLSLPPLINRLTVLGSARNNLALIDLTNLISIAPETPLARLVDGINTAKTKSARFDNAILTSTLAVLFISSVVLFCLTGTKSLDFSDIMTNELLIAATSTLLINFMLLARSYYKTRGVSEAPDDTEAISIPQADNSTVRGFEELQRDLTVDSKQQQAPIPLILDQLPKILKTAFNKENHEDTVNGITHSLNTILRHYMRDIGEVAQTNLVKGAIFAAEQVMMTPEQRAIHEARSEELAALLRGRRQEVIDAKAAAIRELKEALEVILGLNQEIIDCRDLRVQLEQRHETLQNRFRAAGEMTTEDQDELRANIERQQWLKNRLSRIEERRTEQENCISLLEQSIATYNLEQQHDPERERIERLRAQIDGIDLDLSQRLDRAKRVLEVPQMDVDAAIETLAGARAQLQQNLSEKRKLSRAIRRARSNNRRLNQHLEQRANQLKTVESKLARSALEKEETQKSLSLLAKKVHNLRKNLQEQARQEETDATKRAMSDLGNSRTQYIARLQDIAKETRELEQQLADVNREIASRSIEKDLNNAERMATKFRRQLQQKSEEINTARQAVSEALRALRPLKAALAEPKAAVEEIEAQMKRELAPGLIHSLNPFRQDMSAAIRAAAKAQAEGLIGLQTLLNKTPLRDLLPPAAKTQTPEWIAKQTLYQLLTSKWKEALAGAALWSQQDVLKKATAEAVQTAFDLSIFTPDENAPTELQQAFLQLKESTSDIIKQLVNRLVDSHFWNRTKVVEDFNSQKLPRLIELFTALSKDRAPKTVNTYVHLLIHSLGKIAENLKKLG